MADTKMRPGPTAWRDRSQTDLIRRLRRYDATHGDVNVPSAYTDRDGYHLGARVRFIRRTKGSTITTDTLAQLNALGFIWDIRQATWDHHVVEFADFVQAHGHGDPPVDYVTDSGFPLGRWLCNFRKRLQRQPRSRVEQLTRLGARLDWDQWLLDDR